MDNLPFFNPSFREYTDCLHSPRLHVMLTSTTIPLHHISHLHILMDIFLLKIRELATLNMNFHDKKKRILGEVKLVKETVDNV